MSRSLRLYLDDILTSITKIQRYTTQMSQDQLVADNLLQSWIDDEDGEEQQETGQYLIDALDKDRLSDRQLFPYTTSDTSDKNYPLRGMPITISDTFDEPMSELWDALGEWLYSIPILVKDPADRILVAIARRYNIPLVSCDRKILSYPHVQTIW